MRRWAFVIGVVGLFILVFLMSAAPREISNMDDIKQLTVNAKIVFSGTVVDEKVMNLNMKRITLDTKMVFLCDCSMKYAGNYVRVVGVVNEYKGKKEIQALEVSVLI